LEEHTCRFHEKPCNFDLCGVKIHCLCLAPGAYIREPPASERLDTVAWVWIHTRTLFNWNRQPFATKLP